jgi:hypothetical protein
LAQLFHLTLAAERRIIDVLNERLASCIPAFELGKAKMLDRPAQFFPGRLRQSGSLDTAGGSVQVLVNPDRNANYLPPENGVCGHRAFSRRQRRMFDAKRTAAAWWLVRPFNLDRREADPIAFAQHLVGRDRLAVHANQIVVRLAAADLLLEELADGRAFSDLDVIREATAVVVDKQNLHAEILRQRGLGK